MTTYTGQNGSVKDGSNAVGEVKSFEVNVTADVVEDTVMGDSWKTNQATHNSWSASVSVLHDRDDTTGQGAFSIGATVSAKLYPSGDASGNVELAGSAIVTSRNIASTHDGLVTMELELTGTGALTEANVV